MAKFAAVACFVLICMAVVAPHATAITCGQVVSAMKPCIPYVIYGRGLSRSCCMGIRYIVITGALKTTADRRAACSCLKSFAGSLKNFKTPFFPGLPGKCGVRLPYTISANTDCSKVS